MHTLPFHPNTKTHDHDTRIKHNIQHPGSKHLFAKNCVHFDIPRIVNNCPNSILDQINTYSINLQGKLHYSIVDCYVCNK